MIDILTKLAEQIPAAVAVGLIVAGVCLQMVKMIVKEFTDSINNLAEAVNNNTTAAAELKENLKVASKLDKIIQAVTHERRGTKASRPRRRPDAN